MAKLKFQGSATGTGTVTLVAPTTDSTRTITLPDETVSLTGAPVGLDDVSGVARATSGLLFNGDTAAANALDDYEEGTWTPSVAAGTGTLTTVATSGIYVKVGRSVTLSWQHTITTNGTGSGNLRISALPFACSANGSGSSASRDNGYSGKLSGYYMDASSSVIVQQQYDNAYPANSGSRWRTSLTYQTDA